MKYFISVQWLKKFSGNKFSFLMIIHWFFSSKYHRVCKYLYCMNFCYERNKDPHRTNDKHSLKLLKLPQGFRKMPPWVLYDLVVWCKKLEANIFMWANSQLCFCQMSCKRSYQNHEIRIAIAFRENYSADHERRIASIKIN